MADPAHMERTTPATVVQADLSVMLGKLLGAGTGPFKVFLLTNFLKHPPTAISLPPDIQGCSLAANDFNGTLKISPSVC